jgi:hypothetical protein
MRPPTQNFLRKTSGLQPKDAVIQSASEETPEEGPAARFTPEGEADATTGEPRYLRPYLLATAPFLADVGIFGKVFPGECKLRYRSANESEVLQPMEELEIILGANADVKPGDLFKIYEVGAPYRSFRSNRALGRLVEINGMAEVVRVGPGYAVAELSRCFGRVSRRSRAAPMGDWPQVRATGYAPAGGNLRVSRIVWVTPPHQIPQPFSQAIIDGGSQDGFQVGDFIVLLDRRNGKMTDRILGDAVVLRSEAHSSTLLLQDVRPGVINPGDFAVAHLSPTP